MHLYDIPPELLDLVFGHLERPALHKAVSVSKYINVLSEPHLYRHIAILAGSQATSLSQAFDADDQRVLWVRSLLVSVKFGDDAGLHKLPLWISQMHNLRDIRLETPDCNQRPPRERIDWLRLQDRYERIFGQASVLLPHNARCLPNLESCTIHFVDANFELITLKRHHALFLHPNMRTLTISCASTDFVYNLPEVLTTDSSLTRSTRLEHLHLEECDIEPSSLRKLLRLSRNLKSLKISEGTRYLNRVHGNIPPDRLVEAMTKYCSKSLVELSLALGYHRHNGQSITQRGQHLNLTLFDNLKHLSVDRATCALIRSYGVCDHSTYRRLPPSLESLTVFGIQLSSRTRPFQFRARSEAYLPFNTCLVSEKEKHGVPNLRTLTYSYEYSDSDETVSIASSDTSSDTVEYVTQLPLAQERLTLECNKQRHIFVSAKVRLFIEMVILPHGFIPPYLVLEEKPSRTVYWRSDRDTVVGAGEIPTRTSSACEVGT